MHAVPPFHELGPGLAARQLPHELREQRLDQQQAALLVRWNISPLLMVNQAPAGSRPEYYEHESHGYKSCENLAAALPYTLTFYAHPIGQCWIVTTRAAKAPGQDHQGAATLIGRPLLPQHCAEGPTPLAAVLVLLTEKLNAGQLVPAPRYDCLTQFEPA